MNYVGIDVHKGSLQASIIDEEGDLVEEFRLRNSRDGVEQLLEKVECYGCFQAVVE
jgi:transposase